jgi:hypothetical protein
MSDSPIYLTTDSPHSEHVMNEPRDFSRGFLPQKSPDSPLVRKVPSFYSTRHFALHPRKILSHPNLKFITFILLRTLAEPSD